MKSRGWAVALALVIGRGPGGYAQDAAPARPAGEAPAPVTVEDLVHQGQEARKAGNVRAAVAAFTRARDLSPHTYEIHILLADTLRRAGEADRALPEYDAARALDPARPEGYSGRALILRSRYDTAGAAAILQEGLGRVPPPARADLTLVLAETRRRQGRTDEAERLFTEVLAAAGRDHRARGGLARVAEDRGDLDAILRAWDAYLADEPDDVAAGLRRQEWRELRASIATLRETGRGDRDGAVALELGRLLRIAGDTKGSLAAYRRALRARPDAVEARVGVALDLRDLGPEHEGDAARAFRRVLEIRPDDARALYGLLALAIDAGDPAAQEEAWRSLVRARPADLFALRGRTAFLETGGGAVLERALQESAAAPPTPDTWRSRALLQSAAGQATEAAETLYRLLLADPTDPWSLEIANDLLFLDPGILRVLAGRAEGDTGGVEGGAGRDAARRVLGARLAWWSGRGGEALVMLRQTAAAFPRSAVVRSALAEAYQEIAHEPALALVELRRAVDLDPRRRAAHVDLTLALLRAGRASEAAAAARRGLETTPADAPILSVLGAALMDQGDFEAAASAWQEALAADPPDNFGLARSQLPTALAALGRNVEARRVLAGDAPRVPDMLYRDAWAFARDVARDRGYAGQDWRAWRTRFRGALRSEADAWRAISEMLASLGDPYTRLRDPEETAAMYLARRGPSATTDPLGRVVAHGATVTTGEWEGGLGYIRVGNFTDPRLVADLRAALETMRRREGIVLDLRGNTGGLSRAADSAADLLVGPGREAGVDDTASGPVAQITGGDGAVTEAPITVLVDGTTGSAAERLARALAETGRGTLVGDATFGKGRAQRARVLPGGVTVLVSTSEMLGPDGRPVQGHGLAPGRRARVPGADPAPTPGFR